MIYKFGLALILTTAMFAAFNPATAQQPVAVIDAVESEENDYNKCLQASKEFSDEETALCMSGEIKRLDQAIANLYQKTFIKVKRIEAWNNGNGMFRGNIKDMQDQFNGYRSRFCSFYATTMEIYSGSQMYLRNECMMKLTTEYYARLLQMSRDFDADLD